MSLSDLGSRIRKWWPYLLLVSLLVLVFVALAALNLDLGFVGDVLAYEYHYDRLGIQGGMNWLVNVEWQRHLLASIYSAPVHLLFPGQSAAWYGLAFLLHFANGVICFLLVDTLLRGQRRWIAFSVALVFVFDALQIPDHFEFPTGSHRKAALFLALLSLWLYLQWIRHGRQNRWWRELSFASYVIAVASYEQTAFFFLLHPIIAYFEDGGSYKIKERLKWLGRVTLDSIWYPIFLGVYLFLLYELFPDNEQVALSLNRIIEQMLGALQSVLAPSEFMARLLPALQSGWLLLTLAVGIFVFAIIWHWNRANEIDDERAHGGGLPLLAAVGLGMMIVSIAAVAPTTWSLTTFPKLFYPAAVGFAMVVSSGLEWMLEHLSFPAIRRGLFALAIAFLVATGTTRMFQVQQEYVQQNRAREAVKQAILQALPSWNGNTPPYLLILSDAHPSRDLALHPHDVKFPLMFDMMYHVDGIAADAIFSDVPTSEAPPPDMPGSRYLGRYIVVESEGIYSPVQPGVPISPDRLVIVYYDSLSKIARVLDELPPEILATANIIERTPIEWRTNPALIAENEG